MNLQQITENIMKRTNFTTTDNTAITYSECCTPFSINRKQYEEDLARRQKEHLDSIYNKQNANWRPCLHDACPECLGTGVRRDGSSCIHGISCPCPKCTPSY